MNIKSLTLLGVTLNLNPKPRPRGWGSQLHIDDLSNLLDTLATDFPTRDNLELAEIATDLLHEQYPDFDSVNIYYHTKTGLLSGYVNMTEQIVADHTTATLTINHIGWSLRCLQGAAAACDPNVRRWNIQLMPANVCVGNILLKRVSNTDNS